MKQSLLIIALFISCSVFGQEATSTLVRLDSFLSVDQPASYSSTTFNSFLTKLQKKKEVIEQENDFVRYVFTKAHQQYLKKFEEYASINKLFSNGSYNCLTGTILYTLLLDHFNISHQVIETNYHIFILANTKQGQILLEATDPLNGFVDNPVDIENRINTYKENSVHASNRKQYCYQFTFQLYNTVTTKELLGLLYYNQAVDAYNHQNLQQSIECLKKTHPLYTSVRIDEFSQLLLLTLQQSKMEPQLRVEYIQTVLSIRRDLMPIVASLQ